MYAILEYDSGHRDSNELSKHRSIKYNRFASLSQKLTRNQKFKLESGNPHAKFLQIPLWKYFSLEILSLYGMALILVYDAFCKFSVHQDPMLSRS